jgi:hypothetical protein
VRCEALKAEKEVPSGQDIQRELEELELQYKKLKVTFIPVGCRWLLGGGAWCKLYSFSLLLNWIHKL